MEKSGSFLPGFRPVISQPTRTPAGKTPNMAGWRTLLNNKTAYTYTHVGRLVKTLFLLNYKMANKGCFFCFSYFLFLYSGYREGFVYSKGKAWFITIADQGIYKVCMFALDRLILLALRPSYHKLPIGLYYYLEIRPLNLLASLLKFR